MAGLGGLAAGFQAGFGMMDRHYQNQANQEHRQWQRERAEQQDARQAQLHDLKVGEYERQDQLRGLNALLHQANNADGPMEINFKKNEWAEDAAFRSLREKLKFDPSKVVGENRKPTEQAVQWFDQLASGQDNRRPIEVMNDERTLSSAQVLLGELVNANLGETYERDGKTFTIEDKRISSVVPAQGGDAVYMGLSVRGVGPDGEVDEYEAPMTEGHSAQDEMVLRVPIEKIMQRVQGTKALLQGTANLSPDEVRAALEPEILRLGGELPEEDVSSQRRQMNELTELGMDPEQAMRHAYGIDDPQQDVSRQRLQMQELTDLGMDPERAMRHAYGIDDPQQDGGAGGLSGTDEKRLFDRAIGEIDSTFRMHVGEEFMGDPEIAQLRSLAAIEAAAIVQQARVTGAVGANLSPEIVGNTAAEMALSNRYEAMRPGRAEQLAREEIGGGWGRGPDEEEVQARASELRAQAQQQFRSDLMRNTGLAEQGQGGLQGAPAPGGQPQGQGLQGPGPQQGYEQEQARVWSRPGGGETLIPPNTPRPPEGSGAPGEPVSGGPAQLQPGAGIRPPSDDQLDSAIHSFDEASAGEGPSAGTIRGRELRERVENDALVRFVTRGIEYGNRSAVDELGRLVPSIPGRERVADAAEYAKDAVAALFGAETPTADSQLKGLRQALEEGREPTRKEVERAARWADQNRDQLNSKALLTIEYWLNQTEGGRGR